MRNAFIESVYDTLHGNLTDEACVPGVDNLFADGSLCDSMYDTITSAYERLLNKLDEHTEDVDLELIMNAFFTICKETGIAMYRCGAKFGMME